MNQSYHEDCTVAQVIHDAARMLRLAGCDSPRLDAEVLLAHTLGYSRSRLLADGPRLLTQTELQRYASALERRQRREPLPYITGTREFFGLTFSVNKHVLVPRPESELLVEHALRWIEERGAERIVDVGSGSGCLTVAIAVNRPKSIFVATDLSAEALSVTSANAVRHGVRERVWCAQGDMLAPLAGPFDLIVANPPYIKEAAFAGLQPEVQQYEPRMALDGGQDGLRCIDALLQQAGERTAVNGAILIEIGWDQGSDASELAGRYFPSHRVAVIPDHSGNDRLLAIYPMDLPRE